MTEIEADQVGASLKWATAKVERSSQRGKGERTYSPCTPAAAPPRRALAADEKPGVQRP